MGLADSQVLARFATGAQVRRAIRQGRCFQQTSGLAPGFVQGNIVILPAELAGDFQRFCVRNPKPCPLLAMGDAGDPTLPTLGEDIDVRTDLPRYRVWRHGELVDEPIEIRALWRNDLVSFVLGCSFSFDEALLAQGIPLRHIERGTNVPMYRTSVQTTPAGPFRGPLVVSMRPLSPGDAIRAIQITTRFPSVHGAPVHIGKPELLGIGDLSRPDYGDPVEIQTREIAVFWACGVTPQAAIATARLPFCITHAPGAMLVTDQLNAHLATS